MNKFKSQICTSMERINIAELLKDCPKGMELYSPIFGKVYLDKIRPHLAIVVTTDKYKEEFLYDGRYGMNGECMLFPSKGKTTWEGFQRPFKDGDVLVHTQNERFIMSSYKSNEIGIIINTHVIFRDREEGLSIGMQICCYTDSTRLATEEEKQRLFQAIKDNGYNWNAKTKTLEKLVEPRFKVGDRIKSIISSSYYTVVGIKNDQYFIKSDTEKYPYQVSFSNEINYKLVLDKFDITTLKPFDRVLMRSSNAREWVATFYSHYSNNKFYGCGMCCDQCIPYEKNEHLLGTTNDCDNFFKTW